jgi:adenylylsulfate kinase-like enzyme
MVSPREREERLGQRGAVVLLSGLPGAGKTELAYAVERLLHDQGRLALVIDPADSISLENADLRKDPTELSAAALELARRAADLGVIVLLPFAAPRLSSRQRWQAAVGDARWLEVAVDTPLETCKARATSDFYAQNPRPSHDASLAPAASMDGSTGEAAGRFIVSVLEQRGFIAPR